MRENDFLSGHFQQRLGRAEGELGEGASADGGAQNLLQPEAGRVRRGGGRGRRRDGDVPKAVTKGFFAKVWLKKEILIFFFKRNPSGKQNVTS